MGKKKAGEHVLNTYLSDTLYQEIKDQCVIEDISMSKFMNNRIEDFLSELDAANDTESMLSKFRNKTECSFSRYIKRVGVGIIMNDDRYLKIKALSESRNTPISEIFRVLSKEYMDKVRQKKDSEKINFSMPIDNGNGFQMFIDLS